MSYKLPLVSTRGTVIVDKKALAELKRKYQSSAEGTALAEAVWN